MTERDKRILITHLIVLALCGVHLVIYPLPPLESGEPSGPVGWLMLGAVAWIWLFNPLHIFSDKVSFNHKTEKATALSPQPETLDEILDSIDKLELPSINKE